jgi:acetylornithine deacetylase/succinyl-diaminopimelate desuccinylase-like protein
VEEFLGRDILDVLRILDRTPAPRGQERAAAEALRDWCTARWPDVDWSVQPYGAGGANLIGHHRVSPDPDSSSLGVLLYSHVDTSLDGSPTDIAVTGRPDPTGPLTIEGNGPGGASEAGEGGIWVHGFGLGVARGPAAAALVGFAELVPPTAGATLLLAGSGTHRSGSGPTGLDAYLAGTGTGAGSATGTGAGSATGTGTDAAAGLELVAAVVAKAGPVGVLWSEPGAAYLQVRVSARPGAVLARDRAEPPGGLIAQAGLVLTAFEAWRRAYVRSRGSRADAGQVGAEAGIGAIRAGLWSKPDLLPATLEFGVYVVTVPGEQVAGLAQELEAYLGEAIAGTVLADAGCLVSVRAEVVHAAGGTAPDAAIVQRAISSWQRAFSSTVPSIRGWTGSTDGVVLRGRGVDTVRLGPQISASAEDPRRDVVRLADLVLWARLYADLLTP